MYSCMHASAPCRPQLHGRTCAVAAVAAEERLRWSWTAPGRVACMRCLALTQMNLPTAVSCMAAWAQAVVARQRHLRCAWQQQGAEQAHHRWLPRIQRHALAPDSCPRGRGRLSKQRSAQQQGRPPHAHPAACWLLRRVVACMTRMRDCIGGLVCRWIGPYLELPHTCGPLWRAVAADLALLLRSAYMRCAAWCSPGGHAVAAPCASPGKPPSSQRRPSCR